MSDDLIRRAREALVDVAPGPWEAALEKGCHGIVASIQDEVRCVAIIGNAPETPEREPMRFANAGFIAAARDLVPALADRLEAQDALLREVWGALDAAAEALDWALAEISEYANIMSRDPGAVVGIAATAADEARATLAKLREHLEGGGTHP